MRHLRVALVLLVVITVNHEAVAQTHNQDYAVPGHGKLRLQVPDGWVSSSKSLEQPAAVVLRLNPASGDLFDVQVTTVWLNTERLAKTTLKSLKSTVEETAEDPLRQAVESKLVLVELRGAETMGYYYSLTDRNPAPGEYKYLTQGAFLTGELMTVFTILNRENTSPEVARILEMMAGAQYVK